MKHVLHTLVHIIPHVNTALFWQWSGREPLGVAMPRAVVRLVVVAGSILSWMAVPVPAPAGERFAPACSLPYHAIAERHTIDGACGFEGRTNSPAILERGESESAPGPSLQDSRTAPLRCGPPPVPEGEARRLQPCPDLAVGDPPHLFG